MQAILSFDLIDQNQNKRFCVTEIVLPLGFADVTFRAEHADRSDYWKYVCVRRLSDFNLINTICPKTWVKNTAQAFKKSISG